PRSRAWPHLPPFPTRRSSDLGAGAVLGQHRDRDVVALERLLQRMPQRTQAEHLVALPGIARQDAAVLVADLLEQALADEHLDGRSEEHTSELQSRENLVCRLL